MKFTFGNGELVIASDRTHPDGSRLSARVMVEGAEVGSFDETACIDLGRDFLLAFVRTVATDADEPLGPEHAAVYRALVERVPGAYYAFWNETTYALDDPSTLSRMHALRDMVLIAGKNFELSGETVMTALLEMAARFSSARRMSREDFLRNSEIWFDSAANYDSRLVPTPPPVNAPAPRGAAS